MTRGRGAGCCNALDSVHCWLCFDTIEVSEYFEYVKGLGFDEEALNLILMNFYSLLFV